MDISVAPLLRAPLCGANKSRNLYHQLVLCTNHKWKLQRFWYRSKPDSVAQCEFFSKHLEDAETRGVGSESRVLNSPTFSPSRGNPCGNKMADPHSQTLFDQVCAFPTLWSWTIKDSSNSNLISGNATVPFIADIEAATKIIWAPSAVLAAHPVLQAVCKVHSFILLIQICYAVLGAFF